MATLMESAKGYVSKTTKNISELRECNTQCEITEKTLTDKDGKEFSMNVIEVDGQEYRVPASVLKDLQAILKVRPALLRFRVLKTGEGMNTRYTVMPME